MRGRSNLNNMLEQLCELVLGSILVEDSQKAGLWYQLPNQITGISDRNYNSTHPCILFNTATLTDGYAEVWIRSSTRVGEFPEYVPHKKHDHGHASYCPLDKDAHLSVRLFKRIPATYITRISPKCKEIDQDWLRTFEKCCIHVNGKSRMQDHT